MRINKDNFEAFLLDLWEGNLSDGEKAELMSFLEQHPELDDADALSLLSDVSMTQPIEEFDKDLIDFDTINDKNYEFFFIAYSENDLSPIEREKVEVFVKTNPSYAKKFDQFQRAKLPADTVVYPDKKGLMSVSGSTKVISIQARRWMMGVAAASISLFFWFNSTIENIDNKYVMSDLSKIDIQNHSQDPFEFYAPKKIIKSTSDASHLTNKVMATLFQHKSSSSQNEVGINSDRKEGSQTENEQKKKSISNVKVNQLANVLAAIKPNESKKVDEQEPSSNKIKEEIPTVLELTAAYLQRKKVLNNERKPDLKGILNNTLANVNENQKPVLTTDESAGTKRTVFQLGDFKFERIAKK